MADDHKGGAPHSPGGKEHGAAEVKSIRAVDAARFVAGVLGWGVFPCHTIYRGKCTCSDGTACQSPGKHPRTHSGVKDASNNPDTVNSWDARWPDANWAATPGESGVVIDIDIRKGGFNSMSEWGELKSSWSVSTGGAGRHLYFTTDHGVRSRNGWLPGVDVKAMGGYVILPGSRHISGGSYFWDDQPPPAGPPSAPRDLLDSIARGSAGGSISHDGFDVLAGLPEGQRDDGLFREACRLRNVLNGDRRSVEMLLLDYATRCDPPFPRDEALRKVEQAFAQERDVITPAMQAWAENAATMRPTSILEVMRAALLTPDDLDALPDPEWLIEDVITKSGISVLYGSPALGKTFLALDWAFRIGSGLKWFEREVKQGPVLYVYAEGVYGLKQRKTAWVQSTGLLGSDVKFFPRAVPLLDSDWVDALRALCAELRPVLVVIDTLARATAGADENSVKDMSRAVAACDSIREASDAAVMLVHHTGKDGSNYRGSSAIEGAADTMLHLVRRDDGSIELRCSKQKEAEEFDPIPVQLESVGPSAVITQGQSVQGFVLDAARSQLTSILSRHPGTWMSASQIHAEAGSPGSLRTAQRHLTHLFEAGMIERGDSGKSYVYRVASASAWA